MINFSLLLPFQSSTDAEGTQDERATGVAALLPVVRKLPAVGD